MNPIKLPQSKPGAMRRSTDRRSLLWAVVTALTAAAALAVVVPRLVAHGNAHASAIPLRPAPPTIWDSTVPAASSVFVGRERGADANGSSPTF